LKVAETGLPGVLLIEPDVFGDDRGFFMESWNGRRYEAAAGLPERGFVQDNLSLSRRGVLRGLHFQYPHPQGKLISVLSGEVFDVAVDIRTGSPNFGRWFGTTLSAENKRQLWVPEGFAHGFVVTSDEALFTYKCTDYYHRESDRSLLWNDPQVGVEWPVAEPTLSDKDRNAPRLGEMPLNALPPYDDPTRRGA
jgi:dTDP-4-dehydrorhamnose 3,5-epimerase